MNTAPKGKKPITSYEDLEVYQRGMALLRPVHDLTRTFPSDERYGLGDQMRRACKSIPTNIAEGYAKRRSPKEFRAYLAIAMGSANEMAVHLKVARDLGYMTKEVATEYIEAYDTLGKQLNRLITAWRAFDRPPTSKNQQPGNGK